MIRRQGARILVQALDLHTFDAKEPQTAWQVMTPAAFEEPPILFEQFGVPGWIESLVIEEQILALPPLDDLERVQLPAADGFGHG